ncbi:unnamed protein product, partial [Urochloa humidicola]
TSASASASCSTSAAGEWGSVRNRSSADSALPDRSGQVVWIWLWTLCFVIMESPSKRRRRNEERERCRHCAKKKHLYLVLDDWKGGYSIHKLDPDNMEHHLPEHGALRLASPERAPMAFGVLGTNIFIVTNPHCSRYRALPILVYDTETAALTVGPPPPDGHLCDLGDAVAVGGKLYALTFFFDEVRHSSSFQVLSWEPTTDQQRPRDPTMEWSWDTLPALHPDGRTIFMSTDWRTH